MLSQLRAQRDEHVVHHAHAGEMSAGESATGLIRVDNEIGRRQFRAGQVMIGDQHLDAPRACRGHALDAGDTVVDGNDERGLALRRERDDLRG